MIGVTWHPADNYSSPDYFEYEITKLTSCDLDSNNPYLNFNEGQITIPDRGSIDIEAL